MIKNCVNGCHLEHAFFKKQLSLRVNILCISGIPMNDLAPMINCPGVVRSVRLAPAHSCQDNKSV